MLKQLDSSVVAEIQRIEREHPTALVTLLTPLGKIIYTAPICEQIIGYTQAELTGKYFGLHIHPADIPHALLALQDAMLNEQSVRVGSRVRSKSGGYVHVHGIAWKIIDPVTDKTYLLTYSDPDPQA